MQLAFFSAFHSPLELEDLALGLFPGLLLGQILDNELNEVLHYL